MVKAIVQQGIVARAAATGLISLRCWNPRDYTRDVHRSVDDRPYGGGPGMVMRYEPLATAIRAAKAGAPDSPAIYLSPQGEVLTQAKARELAGLPGMILVAGRYEGVDERVIAAEVEQELSIGDYVLSGGEPAALVVIDAVTRLLPGALGDGCSAAADSFAGGLLEHPQYTRPEQLPVGEVPAVLMSGNHREIARWRLKQSLGRTWLRRPDLLEERSLSEAERELLQEFIIEYRRASRRDA